LADHPRPRGDGLLCRILIAWFKTNLSTPTVRTISGLAGSNLLALGVGMIGALVQAHFVGPADLGYFQSFAIIGGYSQIMQLGLLDYFQRFYPYYIGRGETQRAITIAEVSNAWHVGLSALLTSAFLVAGAWLAARGNWRGAASCAAQAIIVVNIFHGAYLAATYRSGHEFNTVSRSALLGSLVNLVVLPLFFFLPYIGLCLRSCAAAGISLLYLHLRRPLRVRWHFDGKECLRQMRGGLPLFSAGYARSIAPSLVQSSLILHYLNPVMLGLWSVSAMVYELMNKVPQAIVTVYTPRLIEEYGRSHSILACFRLCRKAILIGAALVSAAAALYGLVLPLIVPILIPKYVAAIPNMWLMLGFLPLGIIELPYAILVAAGRLVYLNTAAAAGLAALVGLGVLAARLGLGLNGIIAAALAGQAVRIVCVYLFLFVRGGKASSWSGMGAGEVPEMTDPTALV
jgi:O-antigen/teichoic acid export membrane protein